MKQPEISIIIPIYNMKVTLMKCLESIKKSSYKSYEVILVDDASNDQPFKSLKDSAYIKLQLEKRSGPAAARNKGVQLATSNILLFIDADVELQYDTLEKVIETFKENDIAAVVGDYTIKCGQRNFISDYKNLLHTFYHSTGKRFTTTFFTACSAVKKDVFITSGGFEEKIGPDAEDIALGYKLKRMGYKILLNPEIQVKHNKLFTFHSLIRTDIFYRGVPWVKLMLRYKKISNDLNTNYCDIISVFSIYSLFLCLIMNFFFKISIMPFILGFFCIFIIVELKFLTYIFNLRGFMFVLKTIFMKMVYDVCCGLAVLIGIIEILIGM